MLTVLIIAGAATSSVVLGTLVIVSSRARDGYEDEMGFHYGSEPTRRAE